MAEKEGAGMRDYGIIFRQWLTGKVKLFTVTNLRALQKLFGENIFELPRSE